MAGGRKAADYTGRAAGYGQRGTGQHGTRQRAASNGVRGSKPWAAGTVAGYMVADCGLQGSGLRNCKEEGGREDGGEGRRRRKRREGEGGGRKEGREEEGGREEGGKREEEGGLPVA